MPNYFSKRFSFPAIMGGQTKADIQIIKLRYATGLYKALKNSSFRSFRKMAEAGDLEPSHIQKISVGKVNVSLTINVAIANALGITYTELAAYYDGVTEADIAEFQEYLKKQKAIRGKKRKK